MIKKLSFLTLIVLGLSFSIQAQDIDSRLLVKYSKTELVKMQKENSTKYDLLVYSLDNALYIANYSDEKGENDGTIAMPDMNKTYLELGFTLNEVDNQFYKISGSGKGLMVLSWKALELQMKREKSKK